MKTLLLSLEMYFFILLEHYSYMRPPRLKSRPKMEKKLKVRSLLIIKTVCVKQIHTHTHCLICFFCVLLQIFNTKIKSKLQNGR